MGALLFALMAMSLILLTYGALRAVEVVTGRKLFEDRWVISAGLDPEEFDGNLYWSNEMGWVDRGSATIFDEVDLDLNLPYGGHWERV